MPKITITEKDYTRAGLADYSNFAVLIPGFVKSGTKADGTNYGEKKDPLTGEVVSVFDDNGIYEVSSQNDFVNFIGCVPPQVSSDVSQDYEPHYGNQIAYELLGQGYKVLYKTLGVYDPSYDVESLINQLGSYDFWKALEDKANYDFRFVCHGLLSNNTEANNMIAKLAATRGDAVALCDIDEAYYIGKSSTDEIIAGIKSCASEHNFGADNGKYAALFVPSIFYNYKDNNYSGYNKFPASFHYLACFMTAKSKNFAEWYAAAGLTRGVCSYSVLGTAVKLGEAAIDALEPRCVPADAETPCNISVNVIAKVRNSYYLWGNRTAHTLGTEGADDGDLVASHFLNIRQLCSTLKKQIYVACRRFTFDPNSDVLWINFCNAIKPTLEAMKADQGIVDYRFVQLATSQKAKLKARIRIIPIEAVEDFDIEITLEDSFGEASVSVNE